MIANGTKGDVLDGAVLATNTNLRLDAIATACGTCTNYMWNSCQVLNRFERGVGQITVGLHAESEDMNGDYTLGYIYPLTSGCVKNLDSRDATASTGTLFWPLRSAGTYTVSVSSHICNCCGEQPAYLTKAVTVYVGSAANDDCSARTSHGVGVTSREVLLSETDASIGGGMPLEFVRYHNTHTARQLSRSYGATWANTFDTRVLRAGALYRVINPDGFEQHYRDADGDSVYEAVIPKGDRSSLTKKSDGSFVRAFPSGKAETFNASGYMVGVTERTGRAMDLVRDASNLLLRATDSFGRTLSFSYNADGRIIRMTLPDLAEVTYTYSGAGLQSATYPDGSKRSYGYQSGILLSSVYNESSQLVKRYLYDGWNRVYEASTDGTNDKVTLSAVDADRAIVTNSRGKAITYTIDRAGGKNRLVSMSGQPCSGCSGTSVAVTYDADLNVVTRTDGNGSVTAYTYDGNGNVITQTDAYGTPHARTASFTYNDYGQVATTVYSDGTAAENTYDVRGNALTTTNPNGQSTSYTYDEHGLRTSMTDAKSRLTTYGYDGYGNLSSITDPLGNKTTYVADVMGRVLSITAGNATTSYEYDSRGRLKSVTAADGGATRYAFDPTGNVISETSPVGDAVTRTYDNIGRMIRKTRPDGTYAGFGYDTERNLVLRRTRTASGVATTSTVYTYDDHNKLATAYSPSTGYQYLGCYTDASTRALPVLLMSTGATVESCVAAARGRGLLYAGLQYYGYCYGGNSLQYTHVPESDCRLPSDAAKDEMCGGSWRNSVYGVGQPKYSELTYDGNANVKTRRDENGHVTTYSYDPLDRLASITDQLGGRTYIGYDSKDNVLTVTDANGNESTFGYNAAGSLVSAASLENGITNYTHDQNGNVRTETDATGVTVTYEYDAVNRVTGAQDSTQNVTYAYDACLNGMGRLCEVTDASGRTSYEYDEVGRVKKQTGVIDGVEYVSRYAYDLAGRLTSVTYPSGRLVAYSYSRDRLVGVQSNGTPLASGIAYLPFGGMTSISYGNGLTGSIGYDRQYRVSSIASGVQSQIYTYDAAGNIAGITDNLAPGDSRVFGYDPVDRLVAATGPWGTINYGYDWVGNRATETTSTGTSTYNYVGNTSRLASIAGAKQATFTYDGNGNTVAADAIQYEYDQRKRLRRVVQGETTLGEYVHNAKGQRVKKTTASGGVIYHYDLEGRLIAETTNTGAIIAEYVYANGAPLAKIVETGVYYYHNDHLSMPQLMTDSSGQVAWSGQFQPFGEPLSISGAVVNNLRFPGQCYDSESGLHQNWFRDYRPETGRYLETDPIMSSLQRGLSSAAVTDRRLQGPYYNQNRWYLPEVGRYSELDPIAMRGGVNGPHGTDWYNYAEGNPLAKTDFFGLDAELCTRKFNTRSPPPYARHCFLRFNGDNGDTSSFDTGGVHPDPDPTKPGAQCTPTGGGDRDKCVKREMAKCKNYDFFGFNCCHCAEQALKACGIIPPPASWPNWPINPGPQPGEPGYSPEPVFP